MSRILLITGTLCFVGGVTCLVVCLIKVIRIVFEMPDVDEGLARVSSLHTWGLRFLGLSIAGIILLWFVPKKRQVDDVEPNQSS